LEDAYHDKMPALDDEGGRFFGGFGLEERCKDVEKIIGWNREDGVWRPGVGRLFLIDYSRANCGEIDVGEPERGCIDYQAKIVISWENLILAES